jgi:hypothetical protein
VAKWLGVDVGDVSVRVALLQSTLRKTSVLGLREEPIAEHGSVGAALRAASEPSFGASSFQRPRKRSSIKCSASRWRPPCRSSSTTP